MSYDPKDPMPVAGNLSTHSLGTQRDLLLHSVRDLLNLETQLRRGKQKLSLEPLNERLLLLSRLAASMLSGHAWPAAMPTPCQLALELWRVRVDVLLGPQLQPPSASKIGVDG